MQKTIMKVSADINRIGFLIIIFGAIFYIAKAISREKKSVNDLVIRNNTLLVGATEEYIDTEMLHYRLQRYYKSKIKIDTHKSGSVKELYRLLATGKIDCIVISDAKADTISMVWSAPYAIDNNGNNGFRLGLPKTIFNRSLIKQFNNL